VAPTSAPPRRNGRSPAAPSTWLLSGRPARRPAATGAAANLRLPAATGSASDLWLPTATRTAPDAWRPTPRPTPDIWRCAATRPGSNPGWSAATWWPTMARRHKPRWPTAGQRRTRRTRRTRRWSEQPAEDSANDARCDSVAYWVRLDSQALHGNRAGNRERQQQSSHRLYHTVLEGSNASAPTECPIASRTQDPWLIPSPTGNWAVTPRPQDRLRGRTPPERPPEHCRRQQERAGRSAHGQEIWLHTNTLRRPW
jgi:hypothetical protein